MKFLQLFGVDRCRGIYHHITSSIVFWEGDKIANGFLSAQNCDQSIKSESYSPVWWRAILESIHQKSKLCFCFLSGEAQEFKDLSLSIFIVDSYRTSTDFVSV